MSKEVYSWTFQQPMIGGGGNQDNIFSINEAGRNLKLTSIFFDWRTDLVAGARSIYTPMQPPIDLINFLEFGTPLVQPKKFNRDFTHNAGLGIQWGGNNTFSIFSGGHYHFDSFFINETLGLRHYQVCSVGSANIYLTEVTIILELETITNFIE